MRLMYIGEYRAERFSGRQKPTLNTLKRWIDSGYLKGARIGSRYYVDLDEEEGIDAASGKKNRPE